MPRPLLALSSPEDSRSGSCSTCFTQARGLDWTPGSQNSTEGRSPMCGAALKGNPLHAIPGCLCADTRDPKMAWLSQRSQHRRGTGRSARALSCSPERFCVLTWTLLWAISPGVGQFVASPKSPTLYPKRKVSLAHKLRVPFLAARSHSHHPPLSCRQLSLGGLGVTLKLHTRSPSPHPSRAPKLIPNNRRQVYIYQGL